MSAKRSLIAAVVCATLAAGGLLGWIAVRSTATGGAGSVRNLALVANPFTATVSVATGSSALAGTLVPVRVAANKVLK